MHSFGAVLQLLAFTVCSVALHVMKCVLLHLNNVLNLYIYYQLTMVFSRSTYCVGDDSLLLFRRIFL